MVSSTISEEREALRAPLKTVPDLNAYAYWPDNIQTPAALVRPSRRADVAMSDFPHRSYQVEVLVSNQDQESAQRMLDRYLEEEGAYSIREALEADPTLGGVVDNLVYEGWTDYGGRRTEAASFIGAVINLTIYPKGS